MFGSLTHLMPVAGPSEPPKDVPPPTPVNFPQCRPTPPPATPHTPLAALLQGIVRPTEVTMSHFEAVGVRVVPDAAPQDLIPDPAFIPDFAAWDALSLDEAHRLSQDTRQPLNNDTLSPGCLVYLERKRELSIPNDAAFRTVRRVPAPKGRPQARLGNSFEFYRHLDSFSSFWDDTSRPKPRPRAGPAESQGDGKQERGDGGDEAPEEFRYYRAGAGHQMPPEYRQNIITAFLKLVAYDYGCNVSMPRTEPRLYLTSSAPSPSGPHAAAAGSPSPQQANGSSSRTSYFSSSCTFVFRTPRTRDAARAGIVEGPLAAVSARHTTSFSPSRTAPSAPVSGSAPPPSPKPASPTPPPPDRDSVIDLGRELVAALLTAQHRAREGRTERRIGEDAWWATRRRWGGGPGGPIGREIDMQSGADTTVGDKDERPSPNPVSPSPVMPGPRRPSSARFASSPVRHSSSGNGSSKGSSKRLKKSGNLPMYDNYRLVRPPAATWDPKTRYSTMGRARGVDYDDVFVVSALFHHVSVLRVRVPDRLLAVLGGADDDAALAEGEDAPRSWGQLEVRRSRWYDFFKPEERIAAMQLVWGMMAYLMRKDDEEENEEADVAMTDA